MPELLPLDGAALMTEWWNSGYQLYNPQGYTGYETHDREWEMYAMAVIDFDLTVYYCFSVRHRPYLANPYTVDGQTPDDMKERRDHLFVEFQLLKRWPEQTKPEFRVEWMGAAYEPFEGGNYRKVMAAFMDFIDNTPSNPCTPVEARWCPRCGDCCCEADWSDLANPECPLHGMDSNHPSH